MSRRPPACDEPLAEMRADAKLRAFAELDSLEPSRAVDRAVLGLAREAAHGGAPHSGPALRWAFPAAIAAAAVCAGIVHRPASRPGTPRVPDQRFVVEQARSSESNALEMVRVSAHYRGGPPRVGSSAASYIMPSGSGESHRTLLPMFIDASVPLLSIRAAPLRKRGAEEQAPRVATRSDRASRRERESTLRRRIRPPELIDSVAVSTQPALQSAGTSSRGVQARDVRDAAAPADPH